MFIFAHRKTLVLLDGEYGSVFKGRSLDFDELRAYIPGDEVRDIDWKATARHGAPLVKSYVAVRRQNVLLVTDTGRNMAATAASGETKRDIVVQALGVMGYLAHRHGDAVGLVHGNATVTRTIPARKGEDHLERILREVDQHTNLDGGPSGIAHQLDFVLRHIKQRSLMVVVADEFLPGPETETLLRRLHSRHELIWFTVHDASLASEPGAGETEIPDSIDVADGAFLPALAVRSEAVRAAYATASREREARRQDTYRRLGIAEGNAGSSHEVVPALFALLEQHKTRSQNGGIQARKRQHRAG
ncbi:DUF58 domain-containing protein [Arthrobacter sp. AZCC_0090]|uniref:DUF58 domain-containing protein n=1 Tax=Arthrobacter sp. AZCC_0090 TaxID=2735881 RepID=UPI0016216611|nr:DUF58 domain-containing protein [Arthrobacter sp. AZCC_0090]